MPTLARFPSLDAPDEPPASWALVPNALGEPIDGPLTRATPSSLLLCWSGVLGEKGDADVVRATGAMGLPLPDNGELLKLPRLPTDPARDGVRE